MISWTFLIGPAVGGVIGGLTNKVAIKMLFRPYKPKYIGKIHIPLTPGIIPKEKERIATAIGGVVSENLLSSEVLGRNLLSSDMTEKIGRGLDGFFARMQQEPRSLREFALQYLSPEELQRLAQHAEQDITHTLCAKLTDKAIGDKVAEMVIEQVMERLEQSVLGRLGAAVFELMRDAAKAKLAENINEMLHNNADEMMGGMIHSELNSLLDKPISQLTAGKEALLEQAKGSIMKAYSTLVSDSLPKILATVNIQHVIEERIKEMDMKETEAVIISVMDKELKALVWFGVLLGFIMGFVTSFMNA
ncbi:MAG: DUF445 family protein [Bacteroidales bacterium]|nr:DUF445 family protein [Bacteroidales bacterium]